MRQFEWSETFALGVPEIDGDHRTMFALVGAARRAAQLQNQERCRKWLARLLEFSQEHFSREEEFLARHGYADVGDHRRYHDEIFSHAVAMKARAADLATERGLQGFCDGLVAFLIDDVVRGDLQMKSFLQVQDLTDQD
jgi:hemerythrin-like metal-binding protein